MKFSATSRVPVDSRIGHIPSISQKPYHSV